MPYQHFFLEHGADVNACRKDHWTPLHFASHYGKSETVQLLLDHGANINAEDNLLKIPLHHVAAGQYVVEEDGVRISQLLLERGADVNAQDINDETPLHLASFSGRLGIVRVLLEHATRRNDRDQNSSRHCLEGEFYPAK